MSSYVLVNVKRWTVKPPQKPNPASLTYLLQSTCLCLQSQSPTAYRTAQNLTACMVGVQICRLMDWLSTAASPSRTVIQVMADGMPSLDLSDSLFQGSSSNSSTNTPDSRCLSTYPGSCVSVASLAWRVRKIQCNPPYPRQSVHYFSILTKRKQPTTVESPSIGIPP